MIWFGMLVLLDKKEGEMNDRWWEKELPEREREPDKIELCGMTKEEAFDKYSQYLEGVEQENADMKKEREDLWAVIRGMKKDMDLEADERRTLKKRVGELQAEYRSLQGSIAEIVRIKDKVETELALDRGYLITCPYCGEEMQSKPTPFQIRHVTMCADKRIGETWADLTNVKRR